MDKNEVLKALELLHKSSKKRNFKQTIDLIINLKELDLKKPEENVNTFVVLPYDRGKESKLGALVGNELISKAKGVFDEIIQQKDFATLGKDKKKLKKLAKKTDFFIAQANLMPQIAANFGRILGSMGKMPNPKAGCVVAPIADLKVLNEKLKKTVKVQTKNEPIIKIGVGLEDIGDDKLAENIMVVYNLVLHSVPQEIQNIRNVMIKNTMGKPLVIGSKEEVKVEEPKEKKKKVKKNGKEKV